MIKATAVINTAFNGINLFIDSNMTKKDKKELADAGYRWHHKDKYYYQPFTTQALNALKKQDKWEIKYSKDFKADVLKVKTAISKAKLG